MEGKKFGRVGEKKGRRAGQTGKKANLGRDRIIFHTKLVKQGRPVRREANPGGNWCQCGLKEIWGNGREQWVSGRNEKNGSKFGASQVKSMKQEHKCGG